MPMKILLYDWYTDLTRLLIVDPILAIQLIRECKILSTCATTNPGRLQPRRYHCLRSLGLPSAASTSRAHDPTRRPPAAASAPQTSSRRDLGSGGRVTSRNMYVVHCAVDCTASIAGGLISFDIDASLIYTSRSGSSWVDP